MNEIKKNGNNYIGYEYTNVTVRQEMESLYADNYSCFGWELEKVTNPILSITGHGVSDVNMRFKRNRKLCNRAELTRLQRQFDSLINEIISLERGKLSKAMIVAFTIGIIGTAFMAGSVFAYLGGMTMLCAILAFPAFAGWIAPYFCYLKVRRNKTAKLDPIIDEKLGEIFEVCEKASGLLK